MGELNLDKIEGNYESEQRPDIFQFLNNAPKSLQPLNCSPETCKTWMRLLAENHRFRSKVRI